MNHLDDFHVFKPSATAATSQPTSATPSTPAAAVAETATPNTKRSHKKKEPAGSKATPLRKVSTASKAASTPAAEHVKAELAPDVTMTDAPPILSSGVGSGPTPHPGDNDQLLVSRIPPMPSDEEIKRLLSMPPLSYPEAKGSWTEEDRSKPVRQFCEVCGYWGRVRCTRCGGKMCALECLNIHQEECFTRYGA